MEVSGDIRCTAVGTVLKGNPHENAVCVRPFLVMGQRGDGSGLVDRVDLERLRVMPVDVVAVLDGDEGIAVERSDHRLEFGLPLVAMAGRDASTTTAIKPTVSM